LWTTPAIRQQISAIVGHYRLYCWAIQQSSAIWLQHCRPRTGYTIAATHCR